MLLVRSCWWLSLVVLIVRTVSSHPFRSISPRTDVVGTAHVYSNQRLQRIRPPRLLGFCRYGSCPCLAFATPNLPLVALQTITALGTYTAFVVYCDRPRGELLVEESHVEIKASTIPGAGLGLFAATDLPSQTVLGTYPGVVVPLETHAATKLRIHPRCEGYIWRFSDNRYVIDPTNAQGMLDATCQGGNPQQLGSLAIFQLLNFLSVPTTLCRINEPPIGKDVNVVVTEDLKQRKVVFALERDVYAGEELFIDYGLSYDRSRYARQ